MIQLPNKELMRPKFLYRLVWNLKGVFFSTWQICPGPRLSWVGIRLSERYHHYDHLCTSCQWLLTPPEMARLLDITVNNGTIPRDWKKAIVVPIHKGGDRSVVKNYRPVSLTSVVCKQMEHVIAGYIRQVWEDRDWLYEGQHGFRPEYSCESQIITVCQDISDSIDEATRLEAIIIDFRKRLFYSIMIGCVKKLQSRLWIQRWSYGLGNFW